jgi:tetraacyldisaccharide-1-P 4'-kinase
VDDGFSHWGLERDLDVVLLDRTDSGAAAAAARGPAARAHRALQRAAVSW